MSEDLGSNLDVLDAPAPKVQKAKKAEPVGMPTTTKIILEESELIPPGGLYVGHNGNGYLIQTGMPVDVPDHILEILDHATISSPVTDPISKQVIGYRDRLRYAYRKI